MLSNLFVIMDILFKMCCLKQQDHEALSDETNNKKTSTFAVNQLELFLNFDMMTADYCFFLLVLLNTS